MVYIYISRADGEWARYDVGEISEGEDFWTLINRISLRLWDVLPEETDFTLEATQTYETFLNVEDLISWIEEGEPYVVAGILSYDSDNPVEARFSSEESAVRYAEGLWFGLTEDEKEASRLAVLKAPEMEILYSLGFM